MVMRTRQGLGWTMLRLGRQLTRSSRPLSNAASAKPLWGNPHPATTESNYIELTVNGQAVKVPPGTTVMQAAAAVGVDVPRFCYHERLKIAGNCRMCLVQVNGGPKLMASCAVPAGAKMVVETNSDPVKKAREGVMEFLLANHPLDCPICDQGGECDLQDQAMAFGSDRSRFRIEVEDKRAVEDKNFGPLVKTSMNRCIQCTRCVRFANEIAGVDELGTTGRGNDMQIGTYIEKTLDSELSGNIIDLCPVGALTSKPYAFMTRPWELRKTESIDVMDAVGSNIRVDSRGMEVMRVLPRLNESINEEWLADKSRFACDGLRQQRLTQPLIRRSLTDGRTALMEASWEDALLTAATRIRESRANEVEAILGPFTDMETVLLARELMAGLGSKRLYYEGTSLKSSPIPSKANEIVKFNSGIEGIESADAILLIGCNPRWEAPLVNARIRKAFVRNPDLFIGALGEIPEKGLTYEVDDLGKTVKDLESLTGTAFWKKFQNAKRPAIIVGQSVYDAGAFKQLSKIVKDLPNLVQKDWNGYNFLPLHASQTGAHSLGWTAGERRVEPSPITILLGADDVSPSDLHPSAFVVYIGHHGDQGAQLADVVLPSAAYTEKDASWMNMEGRVQRGRTAVPPPAGARPDWEIVRALAEVAGVALPHNTLYDVQAQLEEEISLAEHGIISLKDICKALDSVQGGSVKASTVLKSRIGDYYQTDSISRASPTMARCSETFASK